MAIRFPATSAYLSLTVSGGSLPLDNDGTVFVQLCNPNLLTGSQYRVGLAIFTVNSDYGDPYIWLGFVRDGANQKIELDVYDGSTFEDIAVTVPSLGWVTGGIGYTYTASTGTFELFVNGVSAGTVVQFMTGLSATSVIVGSDVFPGADTQPNVAACYPRIRPSVMTGGQLAAEGASATPIAMIEIGLSSLESLDDLGAWAAFGAPIDVPGPLDAAPTNVTPSTATVISPVPYSEVANATDAPTSALVPTCGTDDSGLWWVYTPTIGVNAIGITVSSVSASTDYTPGLSIWTGTLPLTLTQRDESCYLFSNPTRVRIAVVPGTAYYLLITRTGVSAPAYADLTLAVTTLLDPTPAGSLVVTSDIGNQATVILSAVDGSTLRAVGMAASEQGDFVPSGVLANMGEDPGDANTAVEIELWNPTLTAKVSVTSIIRPNQLSLSPIRSDQDETFYVASALAAAPAIINTVSVAGVVGMDSWTLPANSAGMHSMGVTRDGATLYYATQVNNTPVYAYDLPGDAAAADFLAAPGANLRWERDIWVLASGDVLIVQRNTNTNALAVKHYDDSGSLLFTYPISGTFASNPRMGLASDDSYFWIMSFPSAGVSRFQKFTMGNIVGATPIDVPQNDAAGEGPLFGPAQSCPLLVTPIDIGGIVPPPGPGTTRAIRRERVFQLPSSDRNYTMKVPDLTVLLQPGIGDGDPDSQGYDPQVMLSVSKDGGKTYLPEQWASAGKQGEYTKRVKFTRTPNQYRNGAVKIVVTDPNDWTLLDVVTSKIEEGTS